MDIMIPYDFVAAPAGTAAAYPTPLSGVNAGNAEFYITGDAGSQRVTINVVSTADLTVVDGVDNKFTIKFFDQNIDGVFIDLDGDGTYDDPATVADNTRCIDLESYDNETVHDSLDTAGDVYTFVPSNPQVAHVVSSTDYKLFSCAKATASKIALGSETPETQDANGTENCEPFDLEDGAGYCNYNSEHPSYLIVEASNNMAITDYIVSLEIMTAGVYFTEDEVELESFPSGKDACDDDNRIGDLVGIGATYTNADGDDVTPGDGVNPGCEIPVAERAVKLVTSSVLLDASGAKALRINVPALVYNLDEVAIGDEVEVKVTLTKAPCGDIIEDTFSLGVFGCDAGPGGPSSSMSFPYFTEITGDGYWDGLTIVNKSGTDGTAKLTIYEADGDVFIASIDVAAHSMETMTTAALLPIATQIVGSGTMGDARFYMEVTADFDIDGFAMMANSATGESMGYLPRLGN